MARMDSRAGTAKRAAARTSSVTTGEPDVRATTTAADEPTVVAPVLPVVTPTAPVPGPPPAPVAPAAPVPTATSAPLPSLTPEQATCRHTVTRTRQRAGKLWRYCDACGYEVTVDQAPREVLRPLQDVLGAGRGGLG